MSEGEQSGGNDVEAPPLLAPPVMPPPPVRPRASGPPSSPGVVGLLAVPAVVGAGFFLVLKAGFLLHGDPQPAPISSGPLTTAAALVFGAGLVRAALLGLRSAKRASERRRLRVEAERAMSEAAAARHRRAEALAANPATAKYAPLVARGETWSDEDIVYAEDPAATATCIHLQPVERAMRAAGISLLVLPLLRTQVSASCRIDLPALQRSFDAGPPVRYAEFYAGDRYDQEHPAAFLICDTHKSIIHTLHPDESGSAPTFPSA